METSELRDEELVQRYLAGDQEAGRQLLDRLFPVLRARLRPRMGQALRRRVGESDIIQSAFASILGRLHEFRDAGPGSFRRWVEVVVDRRLVDELRRFHGSKKRDPRRERSLDDLDEPSFPSDRGASPSSTARRGEEGLRLREAIALLTRDHREVISLVHARGLSLQDAALVLGRSAEAVRKLYARALKNLAEKLRTEDGP